MERAEEGTDLTLCLLLARHLLIVRLRDSLAVGILHIKVPVDDGHGLGSFLDADILPLSLQKREIDGSLIAVHRRVHLEEERVGTGVVAPLTGTI